MMKTPLPYLLLLLHFMSGCSGRPLIFELNDNNAYIKSGTIAVLSGTQNDTDVRLAQLITERLKEKKLFQVISQNDITRSIPKYPLNIVDSKDSAVAKDLSLKSKGALENLQKKIKSDYLMVVWSEGILARESQGITKFYVDFNSRLIEYPNGRIIGYSAFEISEGFLSFRNENDSVERLLSKTADKVIAEFLKKAKK